MDVRDRPVRRVRGFDEFIRHTSRAFSPA